MKRAILMITVLLMVLSYGCSRSVDTYESEEDEYRRVYGELYELSNKACEAYETEDFLESARIFEELFYLYHDRYFMPSWQRDPIPANLFRSPHSYYDEIFTPMRERIGELSNELGIVLVNFLYSDDYWSRVERDPLFSRQSSVYEGYQDLFYSFLYLYYDERFRNGEDLAELSNYPLINRDAVRNSGFVRDIWRDWEIAMSSWKSYRWNNIVENTSTIQIKGAGIYFDMSNAPYITGYTSVNRIFPFAYACVPEDIRYVITFSQSFSLFGRYDNNTDAYSTITTVTIEDRLTYEVIFRNEYRSDPPSRVTSSNFVPYDTYAYIGYKTVEPDIMIVLSELGYVMY